MSRSSKEDSKSSGAPINLNIPVFVSKKKVFNKNELFSKTMTVRNKNTRSQSSPSKQFPVDQSFDDTIENPDATTQKQENEMTRKRMGFIHFPKEEKRL
jgi:hypothetical protein